jgi:hypothetical protein
MMLRDVTSRGEGGFATRDSLSTSWLKVNASLARERFEHKRSLLECATVKALAVKLWRFGLPALMIGWDGEDSGRASLGPATIRGCLYLWQRRLSDNVGKTFPNRPQHFGENLISRDCALLETIVSV